MARVLTRHNAASTGVDVSDLISDLQARAATRVADMEDFCRLQDRGRGYDPTAMRMLATLHQMSAEDFARSIETLQPGLGLLIAHRLGSL